MLSTVLDFPEGRLIVPFLRRKPQVGVIMNLKRCIVVQQTFCHKVVSFLFFACFVLKKKDDQDE